MTHSQLAYKLLVFHFPVYFFKAKLKYILALILMNLFHLLLPDELYCQSGNAFRLREKLPEVIAPCRDSAPGYCVSIGGSTVYERITNVHVLERPGNILDITVDVFIANPTNCQFGKPCPVYDKNPENVNVWIDWNGNKIWEPNEKVLDAALTSYNINYGKSMVAKATVNIPPNVIKPTYLRANLGWGFDPEDPCGSFWGYGNVVDQLVLWNMKVANITAISNVEMLDVTTPLLWSADYDERGDTLNTVSNFPLAASMKNGFVTLWINLKSFPSSIGDDSRTDVEWKVVGTNSKKAIEGGIDRIIGKSGFLNVDFPQKIGMYDLKLKFKFKNNLNNNIGEQIISLPFWISYDKPQIPTKKIWLQKAIEWTQGIQMSNSIEYELAQKIMDGIYSKSGWQYNTSVFQWFKLIEGSETYGGNCVVMANIWLNLLKSLGVGGVSTVNVEGKVDNKGFMAIPGIKAFGSLPSKNGNATKDYIFRPTHDRWVFHQHTFGQLGNTYFDPTFNITGNEKYFHVAHSIIGMNPRMDFYITDAGGPTIQLNNYAFEEGWMAYTYKYETLRNNISLNRNEPVNAAFTGSFSEKLIDNNNDEIFDQLSGNVGVEITNPGKFMVTGYLRKDNRLITSQPYYASPVSWFEIVGPQAGIIEVHPLFSGEKIFTEEMNGSYNIYLTLTDSTGAIIDTALFNTSTFNYQQFGELPARILSLYENAVDTNSDVFFDILKINAEIISNKTNQYLIQKSLFHQGQVLTSESESLILNSGNNLLDLSIGGKPIAISGFNGPFILSLQVSDMDGNQTAYHEIQTSNYVASQFNPPIAKIIGGNSDQGVDINSNGLFDTLRVSISVQTLNSGSYSILAWLMGENGENISLARSKGFIGIGMNDIELNFPGVNINNNQLDGPYKIGYAIMYDDSSNLIFSGIDIYKTQNYSASQFEEPETQIISTTGTYSENSMDIDSDGLIDSLIVQIEVVPKDSGNVVAYGRLVDSKSETILWSYASKILKENIPQWINLQFDGRFIYGGLENGPYQLRDLQIYHSGDPEQTIYIPEACTTQTYKYTDFKKTGVITGIIFDANDNPVANAFLKISNNDNDYSNNYGKYNLVLLSKGEFIVKIEGLDTSKIQWSINMNGNQLDVGDSVKINVDTNQIVIVDFKAPIVLSYKQGVYSENLPKEYFLGQNYPNPFNPSTQFEFALPKKSNIKLKIFDALGNEIANLINESKPAGNYQGSFNAVGLPSGIYFYRLETEGFSETRKMLLIK
ncbi:MAG: T9SS type A sorting domain-containing protein [Ignavibacteriae bacterium]|nr:T9SS type A sorting domain-containing protein [Ignavibacteriota bacterium]